jgi:hypothetical protein
LSEPIHAFGAAHRFQVILPWLGGGAALVVGTVMRLTLPIPVLPLGLLAFLSAYSFERGATRIAALCIGLALAWCVRSIADSAE